MLLDGVGVGILVGSKALLGASVGSPVISSWFKGTQVGFLEGDGDGTAVGDDVIDKGDSVGPMDGVVPPPVLPPPPQVY